MKRSVASYQGFDGFFFFIGGGLLRFQQEIDSHFESFVRGDLNRRTYHDLINQTFQKIPEWIQKKVVSRRDDRTPGEFALQLFDNTFRERRLFELCWPHFKGSEGDVWEDYGIANDGRIIIETRGGNGRLDFLVLPEGRRESAFEVEVKYAPTQHCMTFKVRDMENYLSIPRAKLLVVLSPAAMPYWKKFSIDEPPEEFILEDDVYFLLMDHDAILRVLNDGEHGHHSGFGNKPTVRVYRNHIMKVSEPHYLGACYV